MDTGHILNQDDKGDGRHTSKEKTFIASPYSEVLNNVPPSEAKQFKSPASRTVTYLVPRVDKTLR